MIKISGGNLWRILRRFFKKVNAPYRLVVTNEENMSEALSMQLTKKSVYIFFSTFIVAIFLLLSALFLLTPLRFYIPGTNNNVSRAKLMQLQLLADSLEKINTIREQYILNLIQVANGAVAKEYDSTTLSQTQINAATQNNLSKIDHASKYDYLKTIKKDTTENDESMGKDSLQKTDKIKEKN